MTPGYEHPDPDATRRIGPPQPGPTRHIPPPASGRPAHRHPVPPPGYRPLPPPPPYPRAAPASPPWPPRPGPPGPPPPDPRFRGAPEPPWWQSGTPDRQAPPPAPFGPPPAPFPPPPDSPAAAPVRRPRRWWLAGGAVAALAAGVIGGVLIGTDTVSGSTVLDVAKAQQGVEDVLRDPVSGYGATDVSDVVCNGGSDPKVKKDATFSCDVVVDGERKTVAVVFQDDQGTYAVDRPR